jgi:hypothetical protein
MLCHPKFLKCIPKFNLSSFEQPTNRLLSILITLCKFNHHLAIATALMNCCMIQMPACSLFDIYTIHFFLASYVDMLISLKLQWNRILMHSSFSYRCFWVVGIIGPRIEPLHTNMVLLDRAGVHQIMSKVNVYVFITYSFI